MLVATDVASKGLDFAEIQHVINFDMPKEIEDYGMRSFRAIEFFFIWIFRMFLNLLISG